MGHVAYHDTHCNCGCRQPYTPPPAPRKRVTVEPSGVFRMTSDTGVTTTPLVKMTHTEIRIGCHTVSRDAWLALSKHWNDLLASNEVIVQRGDEA